MAATAAQEAATGTVSWHGLAAEDVCEQLVVDPATGLDSAEVERRRAEYGPNKLAEPPKEPGWHAFLRQYEDLMQYVLVGAAIFGITVLNAILGLNQEGKAAESIAARQKMLIIKAHVRRDGTLADVPTEEL